MAYHGAWVELDPDAIIALHSAETVFTCTELRRQRPEEMPSGNLSTLCSGAGPISVVPSHEVKIIHALKVAINCVVVRHIERLLSDRVLNHSRSRYTQGPGRRPA